MENLSIKCSHYNQILPDAKSGLEIQHHHQSSRGILIQKKLIFQGMLLSFHSPPPTGGVESIRGNSVCLSVRLYVCTSVRHHFNISNLGPSNHPRIMLGLTYYTSLDRG